MTALLKKKFCRILFLSSGSQSVLKIAFLLMVLPNIDMLTLKAIKIVHLGKIVLIG